MYYTVFCIVCVCTVDHLHRHNIIQFTKYKSCAVRYYIYIYIYIYMLYNYYIIHFMCICTYMCLHVIIVYRLCVRNVIISQLKRSHSSISQFLYLMPLRDRSVRNTSTARTHTHTHTHTHIVLLARSSLQGGDRLVRGRNTHCTVHVLCKYTHTHSLTHSHTHTH